jgi:hypothetical protein
MDGIFFFEVLRSSEDFAPNFDHKKVAVASRHRNVSHFFSYQGIF